MRSHTPSFRLSAALAATGLVMVQSVPHAAFAQYPAPSPYAAPGAPTQQTGDPPERVGRLAAATGAVSYHGPNADQWSPATPNYPVASGDAFWTQPGASAHLEIGASRVALAGGTELDVARLDQNGLQATAAQGETYLNLRDLAPGESWSVQTPRGLVTLSGPGRYEIAAGDTQNPTTVTVLDGGAQVSGPNLAIQVGPGQTASITGTDNFIGAVGPAQTDPFLAATEQAERPPPSAAAMPALVAQMPGGDDLAAYGNWSASPDYGEVWYPQVASDWVPYRDGYWAYVAPWGWTWIDDNPWGFAPSHYGRWAQIGGRWGWAPGRYQSNTYPVYAPALVTFIGLGAVGVGIGAALASGRIGWVPLGPREAYRPWYHTSDRYFRAVNVPNVANITTVNRNVTINSFVNRNAVTVVPASAMAASRPVRQVAQRVDPSALAAAHPVVGQEPIRPTAATAGVTPGIARRLNLAPAPAGIAAAPRAAAPGPVIHAQAPGQLVRPTLQNPAGRVGGPQPTGPSPFPSAIRPNGQPVPLAPGARSAPILGEHPPALRAPGTPAAPPPIEHRPGTPIPSAAAPVVHGAAPAPYPAAVPGAPRPAVGEPRPLTPAPAPHPAAAPFHAAPPAAHAAPPQPQVHAAPAAPVHAAPAPQQVHAPPPPQVHAAPAPQVHAPPPPAARPAPPPHPAPPPSQVHAAPAPAPHAPPPQEHEKKPGEK